MMELRKNRNLAAVESDYSKQNPEIKFIINRKKAQDLGISIQSIGDNSIQHTFFWKNCDKIQSNGQRISNNSSSWH